MAHISTGGSVWSMAWHDNCRAAEALANLGIDFNTIHVFVNSNYRRRVVAVAAEEEEEDGHLLGDV